MEDDHNNDDTVEVMYIIEDNEDFSTSFNATQIKLEIKEEEIESTVDSSPFHMTDYDTIKYEVEISNESEPVCCKICCQEFQDSISIKEHLQTNIKCKNNTGTINENCHTQDNTPVGKITQVLESSPSYICAVCNKAFGTGWSLERHKRSHEQEESSCEICDVTFSSRVGLERHTRVHGRNKYTCNLCNKSFVFASAFQKHKLLAHPEKKYFCDKCDSVLNDENSLIIHKRTHADKKEFTCNLCDRSFDYKSSLVMHKRKHNPMKPYNCDECYMSFSYLANYVTHKKMHAGEKPFCCDICNTSFNFKSDLYFHKRKYTGMKIYCNSAIKAKQSIKDHHEQNNSSKIYIGPYSCDLCDMSFMEKKLLKSHQQTFKHFRCDICDNAYFVEANLKAHKRTHIT